MTLNASDLRGRVMQCKDFSAEERKLILDCLALDTYSDKHIYPSNHRPGSSLWDTVAWKILDQFPPKIGRAHV